MRALGRSVLVSCILAVALWALVPLATASTDSRLIFSDEFSGSLDAATWATQTPWNTQYTTGELEYYDPANAVVQDGTLRLVSESRPSNGYAYTSGIVTSLPRAKFTYGYFEIRAKLPSGQGIWPAFWLTNDRSLEIDALEMLGNRPGRAFMTLHENGSQVFQKLYDGPDFSGGFHTFGVDWQPGHVKWYVDGVCRASYTGQVPSDPMWICLNTAVGGAWPGSPTATTPFPQAYSIDYVRVYDTMPGTAAANTREFVAASSAPRAPEAATPAATPVRDSSTSAVTADPVAGASVRPALSRPERIDVTTAFASNPMSARRLADARVVDDGPAVPATPPARLDAGVALAPARSVVSAGTVIWERRR